VWRKGERDRLLIEHAQELRTRFDAGQISLCPYFHMVWWALLIYVVVNPAIDHVVKQLNKSTAVITSFTEWCRNGIDHFFDALIRVTGSFGAFVANMCASFGRLVAKPFRMIARHIWMWRDRNELAIQHAIEVSKPMLLEVGKGLFVLGYVLLVSSAAVKAIDYIEEGQRVSANKQAVQERLDEDNRRFVALQQADFAAREKLWQQEQQWLAEQNRKKELARVVMLKAHPEIAEAEVKAIAETQKWIRQEREIAEQNNAKRARMLANKELMNEGIHHGCVNWDYIWPNEYTFGTTENFACEISVRMNKVHESVAELKAIHKTAVEYVTYYVCFVLFVLFLKYGYPRIRRFYAYLVDQQLETERGCAQVWFLIQVAEFTVGWMQRVDKQVRWIMTVIGDVATLVGHFLVASYRGICPYIEFEASEPKQQHLS
jgi:hypothetical protein